MCDPISLIAGGLAAGATVYQTQQARKSAKEAAAAQAAAQGDPAAERAKAEAEAAQRANAQLAEGNRRRREQGSLLSKGATAPTFSMGDATTDPGSNTLSATGATTRSTVARQASVMSRGAPAAAVPSMSYGGGQRLSGAMLR